MSKRSQTTGLPKEPANKPGEPDAAPRRKAEATPVKAVGAKPSAKREHRSRAEREHELQRYVLIGTGITIAVTLIILGIAFVLDRVIRPGQVVASVEGQNVTVADFQNRVRLERYFYNNQILNAYNQLNAFGIPQDQILQQLQSTQPYSRYIQELQVPDQLGLTVLNTMIDDQLVRNAARERAITVTQDDINKQIEEFFGFTLQQPSASAESTAEASPTVQPSATPTPYVSPTPSPTPTLTPTPEMTPTASPTPLPTLPPTPTLSAAEQTDQFNTQRDNYFREVRSVAGVSQDTINSYFEVRALRSALEATVTKDIVSPGLWVNARHILVATQEEAQDVVEALKAGESFAQLARAISTDTGSGANGGELGWSPVTQYVSEFAGAVRDSAIGEIIGPVKTDFGYHVIQVRARENRELTEVQLTNAKANAFDTWLKDYRTTRGDQIQTNTIWTSNVPTEPPSILQ